MEKISIFGVLGGFYMSHCTINISGKILSDLDRFAKRHHISRVEAAKRAFAILAIANEEKHKGNDLGIIKISKNNNKKHTKLITRIFGI